MTTRQFAAVAALALLGGTALAGCVGDANPVRDAVQSAGFGPRAVAAPDFVERSRPVAPDYLPVGVSAPPRDAPLKSAAQVRALESDLEKARGRNEARGGVRAPAPR